MTKPSKKIDLSAFASGFYAAKKDMLKCIDEMLDQKATGRSFDNYILSSLSEEDIDIVQAFIRSFHPGEAKVISSAEAEFYP